MGDWKLTDSYEPYQETNEFAVANGNFGFVASFGEIDFPLTPRREMNNKLYHSITLVHTKYTV